MNNQAHPQHNEGGVMSISEMSDVIVDADGREDHDSASADGAAAIHTFLNDHMSDMLVQLTEWVRIPSVAGTPDTGTHLAASAEWLAQQFLEIGFPVVEINPTGDSFAVYAEWCPHPTAPTYLIYSHHDVRAAKESTWKITDAFSPVLRGNRLYGRGSSDAKGQIMAHLWGLRAHRAAKATSVPGINLKFLIEGEEEMGSPNLADLLERNAERFAADVVIFSDTLQWSAEHPALCTSIRGMISAHLELHGPEHDVHSGAASGPAPNPIIELAEIVAQLHDEDGRIALPGFYDDISEPTAERRSQLAALPFDEESWLHASQTNRITGERGFSVLERLWVRPSLEVISFTGGDTIDPPRAVIPAAAALDISIRTVPGQTSHTVGNQLREFLSERLPASMYTLTLAEATAQEPYVTPDHPAVDVFTQAMAVGHQVPFIGRMGNAGGGPAELMSRVLGAPVLFYGTGMVGDNWHTGDESIDTNLLKAGAATLAAFWTLAEEQQATFATSLSSAGRDDLGGEI
jgi:acetylornithine deacetylase/succinyl-diaminopimelate desuccinylase-like protein